MVGKKSNIKGGIIKEFKFGDKLTWTDGRGHKEKAIYLCRVRDNLCKIVVEKPTTDDVERFFMGEEMVFVTKVPEKQLKRGWKK